MATQSLTDELARTRAHLVDADGLVRAVASGRQKGRPLPYVQGRDVRRVELRYVDLKSGRHLQVTSYDDMQAHTVNAAAGDEAQAAVDGLLAEPFGNWHVETTDQTHQLRVTKNLEAITHTKSRAEPVMAERGHDHGKARLLPEDDPVFVALGLSDHDGRMKPSRQAKYRQVEEFLRILDASIADALSKGHLRRPSVEDPLRIVDLGCGNGYLTFAAVRFLTHVRDLPVVMIGVDVRQQSADHNSAIARGLDLPARFVVGSIHDAQLDAAPEVVLALHACDTATDEALARAVEWRAPLILAAPCCHHDIASQLRRLPTPAPYAMLTRHGILRERFADTLTDVLRSSLLRTQGYRVDVMQFVESQHTPRNTLLRAVRTDVADTGGDVRKDYDELVTMWGVAPKLASLLGVTGG